MNHKKRGLGVGYLIGKSILSLTQFRIVDLMIITMTRMQFSWFYKC